MSSAGARLHAAADPRGTRLRAEADGRRERVMAAARSAFFELGLEGASLREIAKRAGYTPGAIYSYFDSKEAVYGALLGESLERLNAAVAQQLAAAADAAGRSDPHSAGVRAGARAQLRAGATAFFDYYLQNPGDLALGFYLFNGLRPRGLTPGLNERLNARLRDAWAPVHRSLLQLGVTDDEAQTEIAALFAQVSGLLLLNHTGRMRMFRRESKALFERYLDCLLARAGRLPVKLLYTALSKSTNAG